MKFPYRGTAGTEDIDKVMRLGMGHFMSFLDKGEIDESCSAL